MFWIKRLIIGTYIIMIICAAIKILFHKDKTNKSAASSAFPAAVFLSFTYAMASPLTIVLTNTNDFLISWIQLVPAFAVVCICCILGVMSIAILLPDTLRTRYIYILFSIAVSLYLQANWINPRLPELDGRVIDWSPYTLGIIVNVFVWIAILVIPQMCMCKRGNILEKIVKYSSIGLTLIQVVAVLILALANMHTKAASIKLTKSGEFDIGKNQNVIVFVLDSLGTNTLELVEKGNPDFARDFEDFTLFTNNVAGGSYTQLGIPTLLTGVEYDPDYIGPTEYMDRAWKQCTFYDELVDAGYDVRLYTDSRYVMNVSNEVIKNAEYSDSKYTITDNKGFYKKLYRLNNFYIFPTYLKRYFWLYTDDVTKYIEAETSSDADDEDDVVGETDGYSFDDAEFLSDMQNGTAINSTYEKAYRVYHLDGMHEPYTLDEKGNRVNEGKTGEERQLRGCIYIIQTYIQRLKALGLYNNSTIVITADHGKAGTAEGIQQNSALMVKRFGESHPFEVKTVPVHVRNVFSTIAKETIDDYIKYGPTLWDIDENSDVQRLHTARRASIGATFPDIPENQQSARFVIGTDARDVDSIQIYDTKTINRIDYHIGDVIDFKEESRYTLALQDRLYYDEEGATASNELSMYFIIDDYMGEELDLCFTYNDVMNGCQRMELYLEGEGIGVINCLGEDVGKEIRIPLPGDYIRENRIPVRMLFPGAITQKMIDNLSSDTRVLSVTFDKLWIE